MKNNMYTHSRPQPMETSLLSIWGSLVLVVMGASLHRMGPSFQRSHFGPPLALLGTASFILLPGGETGPEMEMHHSLTSSLPWLVTAITGSLLVLAGNPTYWKTRPGLLLLGWVSICVSWLFILSDTDSSSMRNALPGLWILPGLILGFAMSVFGIWIAERYSGIRGEASPLTDDESKLVSSILSRRLGGDGDGH